MKRIAFIALASSMLLLGACSKELSSADKQREQQETIVGEGVAQVGMPNIVNFRDARAVKFWYERRDQSNLMTYTYTKNMQGQWVWFCDSMGYPIPGGTQFSAPESVQRYALPRKNDREADFGSMRLPQPEPNGIYPPSSAEGSGIICINPNTNVATAAYGEEKLNTFEWPQPSAIGEPDRSGPARPAPRDPLAPPAGVRAPG